MAEKILKELLIELRNGLTAAVINNLVDELWKIEVLNKEEMEDILHTSKSRPNRARELINSVTMKGHEASELFFASLEKNDKTLYKNLKIASRLEALLPTETATSPDKKKSEREEYKMESIPRGLCVIINNENFRTPEMKRYGSHFDVASLQDVFEFLGFEVKKHKDLDASEIKNLMTKYSKDGPPGDCFVCCVLSHGDQCGIFGKDEERCTLKDIQSPFDGVNCPSLVGKPKVFFIQACRGCEMQSKVKVDALGGEPELESDNVADKYTIARRSDFLTAMSTMEGCYSLRNIGSGSWFIQSLCKHLKDGSQQAHDILRILTDVTEDVSRKKVTLKITNEIIDARQIPEPYFTLTKTLIFRVPKVKVSD